MKVIDLEKRTEKIGIVGCGFVADFYIETIKNTELVDVVGVYDIDEFRLKQFCEHYRLNSCPSYEQLLNDDTITLIVNLTSPHSHYSVSMQALRAGKHVYSEKPLAMSFEDAQRLVTFARENDLDISCAPCTLLGDTAQSIWAAVDKKQVGDIFTIYAELDDGLVSRMPVKKWKSKSGAPWPYKNEFEVGCVLEHAAYYLTWMIAIFGPVKELASYGDVLISDKAGLEFSDKQGNDVSIGIIKFVSGPILRLTTTITSPKDHSLTIGGALGVLQVNECWTMHSSVYLRQYKTFRRKMFLSPFRKRLRYRSCWNAQKFSQFGNDIDFSAGIIEMLSAIRLKQKPYLSMDFCLHVTEICLALSRRENNNGMYYPKSTFSRLKPMYESEY